MRNLASWSWIVVHIFVPIPIFHVVLLVCEHCSVYPCADNVSEERNIMKRYGAFLIAIVGAIALAIFSTTPPNPSPKDAPPSEFSAARAMDDVRIIAARPHPTGSEANTQVREYLVQRLTAMGLEVRTDAVPISAGANGRLAFWRDSEGPAPDLVNIIAVLPGKDRSKPALALMAHYDSVWDSPGASDDAAGVAAILETLRAIQTDGTPGRDIVALITDAEELGLEGAAHFFANDPLRTRIGTIINTEARGGGGRTTMFQTSQDNGAAMRVFQDNVSRPATSSLGVFIYNLLPNDTDLTPALEGPYTAYNFAFIGRPGLYHSPLITPAHLDQGSLQDMGAQVLDLTRALATAEELPQKSPDLTFFDFFGLFTIAYAPALGWVMLGLGGLAYAGAVRGKFDGKALLRGAGKSAALVVMCGLLLYIGNLVSGADGPVQYYDRLAAIPKLERMALLAALASVFLVLHRGSRGPSDWAGFALPIMLLAVAGQAVAPTAAYFIVITVMLGGVAAFALVRFGAVVGKIIAIICAVLVAGYMIALGHQFMQGVGPELPMVAALPLVLGMALLLPFWPASSYKRAAIGSAMFTAAMFGLALWIRLDPIAETAASFGRFG
jgi:hypothetical protein